MNRSISSFKSLMFWKSNWLICCLAIISVSAYLLISARTFRIGFPLDDAWIHQTYARNFAVHGEWAFIPGEPSAGSTSPLWSFLLSLGYRLSVPYLYWTFLLGGLCLTGLGITAARVMNSLTNHSRQFSIFSGCFLAIEWHLVWSAVSGMETLLYCLISLYFMAGLVKQTPKWLGLGMLVGICVWVRPDGITLLGPLLFAALLSPGNWKSRWIAVLSIITGVIVCVVPYGCFNRILSGAWLPNTYFAKQAEYAVMRNLPLAERLLQQVKLLMVGPGAIMLPGFMLEIGFLARRRHWAGLGMAMWVIGYLFIYAVRLPVTYQHGRYLIPVLPVFFVLSLAGMDTWVRSNLQVSWKRMLGRGWQISTILLALAFFFLGGRAYAQDVAVIESEMVAASKWIEANTPKEALIAAHDIGALGFFGDRSLLDLAGLISPDVIPFIRDENRIADYLDQSEVDYLMTFPDWYPDIAKKSTLIFDTEGKFSPALGGENMQVFQWR